MVSKHGQDPKNPAVSSCTGLQPTGSEFLTATARENDPLKSVGKANGGSNGSLDRHGGSWRPADGPERIYLQPLRESRDSGACTESAKPNDVY